MIHNIEENGPYVVVSKGCAVPHEGLEQGSVRVGMYLIRLKEPVPFGAEELDPVEFVCCLSAVDRKTHLKAFFNLVNMLQEGEFKDLLLQCRPPEGLLSTDYQSAQCLRDMVEDGIAILKVGPALTYAGGGDGWTAYLL